MERLYPLLLDYVASRTPYFFIVLLVASYLYLLVANPFRFKAPYFVKGPLIYFLFAAASVAFGSAFDALVHFISQSYSPQGPIIVGIIAAVGLGVILTWFGNFAVQRYKSKNSPSTSTLLPTHQSQLDQPASSNTSQSLFVSGQAMQESNVIRTAGSPFSNNAPLQGMALKLKRSERTGAFGKLLFVLDARIDISNENRALIAKYNLGGRIIYESAAREARSAATLQHLENSRDETSIFDSPGRQALGIGKSLFRLGRAAISATAAALSLRITVDSLIAGVHVECKDMMELLEAEEAIVEAGRNLKAEIAAANTFTGQEQVIDL